MLRSIGIAIPLLLAGPANAPGTAGAIGGHAAFQMPDIKPPAVDEASCSVEPAIRLTASTPAVSGVCVEDGRILVNGKDATDFAMTDVLARRFGPVMRGENVPGLHVERVAALDARADDVLGLGLVNASNGIGDATFRDLVWIGDPDAPAINSNDAWAAIALKGKDGNDFGTFTIENFDFQNLAMAPGPNYRNVDGISTEAGYSGTIRNGRVLNATDACLDIKGDVHVDNVQLSGCREGMKIWSSQHHGLVELGTSGFVGIIGKGGAKGPRTIRIDVLIASGDPDVPLFRAEGGVVNLEIGTLIANSGQVMEAGGSFPGSTVTVGERLQF